MTLSPMLFTPEEMRKVESVHERQYINVDFSLRKGHDLHTGCSLLTVCGLYAGHNPNAGCRLTTLGLAFARRRFKRGDAGVPAQPFSLGRRLYAF